MKKKSRKDRTGIVYSTNPDFGYKYDSGDEETGGGCDAVQRLRISLDRKKRGGKVVTLITGYEGSEVKLQQLGKSLKSHCGVGGSVKDGEIILQGDQRDKAMAWLQKQGYKDVKKSGG